MVPLFRGEILRNFNQAVIFTFLFQYLIGIVAELKVTQVGRDC